MAGLRCAVCHGRLRSQGRIEPSHHLYKCATCGQRYNIKFGHTAGEFVTALCDKIQGASGAVYWGDNGPVDNKKNKRNI